MRATYRSVFSRQEPWIAPSGGGDLPLPVKMFLESNFLLNYDRIQRQND